MQDGYGEAQRRRLAASLAELTARQAARYLAGDTSLPEETAAELLRSLVFTLTLARREDELTDEAFAGAKPEALLARGQALLQKKLPRLRLLWQQVCRGAPPYASDCLRETLDGIGVFFRRYDLYFFAHQIPCAIDYPLCLPVADEPAGALYLERWLRQLAAENQLLSCLDAAQVQALLGRAEADWRTGCGNLCAQPATNALGRTLAGKSGGLALDADDCARAAARLQGAETGALLAFAAAETASRLRLPPAAARCLAGVAASLAPRLENAGAGTLAGVFAADGAAGAVFSCQPGGICV